MDVRHILLALTIAVMWGGNFIVTKWCVECISPFTLIILRFVFSTFPLIFFIPRPKNISWGVLIALALTLGVGKFSFVFWSLKMGFAPGIGSLVLQTQVLFTVILSKFFLKTKISQKQAMGMVVAFFGMVAIAHEMGGDTNFLGFLCMLIGAFLWGVANVLFRKCQDANTFSLVIWMGIVPPLPLYGLSVMIDGPQAFFYELSHINTMVIGQLIFIIVGATWIGTTCWAYLFKKYDPGVVAPYGLLIPVVAVLLSWWFFDETHGWSGILGCVLVFLGLVINQWSFKGKSAKLKAV